MLASFGADSHQCEPMAILLGLSEGDLVGSDGERSDVRQVDASFDLDEIVTALGVDGFDVVSLVIMGFLRRGSSDALLGGHDHSYGASIDFLGITGKQLRTITGKMLMKYMFGNN